MSKFVVKTLFPSDRTSADIWIGQRSMNFLVFVLSLRGVSKF